ncbi:hypothetical protein [Paenibacillus sp. 1A_MP2]|uniref:hypothetical protein n=1 Tax=Paenibacillus sp. 1A_MP2 TaxID=3457495 RepID=UPI003FCDA0F7
MNSKIINTVRWKFIYAFLLSGILTAAILYGAAKLYDPFWKLRPILIIRSLQRALGGW